MDKEPVIIGGKTFSQSAADQFNAEILNGQPGVLMMKVNKACTSAQVIFEGEVKFTFPLNFLGLLMRLFQDSIPAIEKMKADLEAKSQTRTQENP